MNLLQISESVLATDSVYLMVSDDFETATFRFNDPDKNLQSRCLSVSNMYAV